MILTADAHLKTDFLVLEGNEFVCNEWLLLLKLLSTVSVKADEASEELESILEVLLLLVHGGITDGSLLIGECDYHWDLFACSV